MGCSPSKRKKRAHIQDFGALAHQTSFSRNEIEALYELYKKVSTCVVKDGLIQKADLKFAIFRNSNKQNLFADRIFDLFDVKRNGHIDFEEFILSLSVFHPKTSDAVKTKYAFKLYDLRCTGYIERDELKDMVLALLDESDLHISDDVIQTIVDKTFNEVDTKGDGRIDQEEWEEYVSRNPSLLKNMTLPYLMDVTVAFPSFVLNTEAQESQL
ncbi:Calcineurin B-like protein 4 [Euphorbia peplus]|nr:Calcineurin B-like protein 4 [Euphorbia peplus]